MKISIILPAYNCAKYIERAIQSVKAQTYTDWECLIVDDGSTDNTYEVADEAIGDDERFLLYGLEEREGASGARNLGIDLAQLNTDAYFFLDADDWIEPTMLEYLVSVAEKYPKAGRIFTAPVIDYEGGSPSRAWLVDMEGLYEADSPFPFKGAAYDIGRVTGCLYIRKNIDADIEFPEEVAIHEDMIFNMGLIFAGISTVVAQPNLYHYTRRSDSLVSSYKYSYNDDEVANAALESLAILYDAPKEMLERFKRFLNMAIIRRISS